MEQDPFGAAFMDYLGGERPVVTIERDDGYMDEHDFGDYFAGFDQFPQCEKDALAFAKGRVLDIGLGAGRVSLHLQSMGLDVTGIDISDLAIETSRRRGVARAVRMSACELDFPKGSFDTAVAFGNNFGVCGTPERVLGMMVRLRDVMADGGTFLAESIDPTATDRPAHLEYHRRNRERGRYPGHVRIRDRYKGMVGGWWDLLMVTPDEMKGLAERAGWKVQRTISEPGSGHVYVGVLVKA